MGKLNGHCSSGWQTGAAGLFKMAGSFQSPVTRSSNDVTGKGPDPTNLYLFKYVKLSGLWSWTVPSSSSTIRSQIEVGKTAMENNTYSIRTSKRLILLLFSSWKYPTS